MKASSKSKQRLFAFWLGTVTMVLTIVGAFILAFMGKGEQISYIASLVGTTNVALAGLGTANYFSTPKDS